MVKAALEQVQPIGEVLLQDLALEHVGCSTAHATLSVLAKLREPAEGGRGRRAGSYGANTETVERLTVALAEEAQGGPAALEAASDPSGVAGVLTGAVERPRARYVVDTVNRTVEGVQQGAGSMFARLSTVAGKASPSSATPCG